MNPLVVDASVAAKWVLAEPDTPVALRLWNSGRPLHAPEFLRTEVASILTKHVRSGNLTPAEAVVAYDKVAATPFDWYATEPLARRALEISLATGRSVYDCHYVALAEALGIQAVTADDRLVNGLAGTPWAKFVVRLADFP
jgi:predicted nucleic acid-binding protein